MDLTQDLLAAETALRDLIQTVLIPKHGPNWYDNEAVVSQSAVKKWRRMKEGEPRKRPGTKLDAPLLDYALLSELRPIIEMNWSDLEPCLLDKEETLVHLKRLESIRNPAQHGRLLIPFEEQLARGICGEIRNLVTLHFSRNEPKHYPRIERVVDSYGNERPGIIDDPHSAFAGKMGWDIDTNVTLRPGDVVEFACTGWDPEGLPMTWQIGHASGLSASSYHWYKDQRMEPNELSNEIHRAVGDQVILTWHVSVDDVEDHRPIQIVLTGEGDFHRYGGFDDNVGFTYAVAPPPGRRRPVAGDQPYPIFAVAGGIPG